MTFIFPFEKAKEETANEVVGDYTRSDAIELLLAGTGLAAMHVNNGNLAITTGNSELPEGDEEAMNTTAVKKTGLAGLVAALFAAPSVEAQENISRNTIEEIVVTATKRSTNIQDTPLAISAFGQATLDANHVVSLMNLKGLVPNLQFFENGDHAVPLIFIRGLGTRNQTEAGDQGIAFYSDGVFAARSQGTTVMMYDLDRVEVLRGPQGTLFGRNSTGGAVSLHSAKPNQEGFDANGELAVGDESMLRLRGMVNIPVTDTWAIRVAGAKEERDGETAFTPGNAFETNRPYGTVDLSSYRFSSLLTPSDNFRWYLALENFRNQGTGDVPSVDFKNRVNNATAPGNIDLDSDNIRTRLDYDFESGYSLSYIGGYSEFDQSQLYGNGVQGDVRNTVFSTYEATQHELQLLSPDDASLTWTAGLFFFEEDNSIRFDIPHGSWGFTPQDSPAGVLSTFVQPSRSLESQSAYAQGTYSFTDAVRLTAGARYIDDKREDVGGRSIDCTFPLSGPLPATIAAQAADLNGGQGCYFRQYNDMVGEWDNTTWLVRGEYDLSDSTLLFISHGTGWKSGVLQDGLGYAALDDGNGNLNFALNNSLLQDPEEVESTEIGIKMSAPNWRLNANIFHMDFTDMQVTGAVIDPVTQRSTLVNTNAGGATIQGLEVEGSASLFGGAGQLSATFAYLDATYDEFLGNESNFGNANGRIWNPCGTGIDPSGACLDNVFDFAGNSLPYAPEYQLTLIYSHEIQLAGGSSIVPRVRASHYDDSFLGWENRGDRPAGTLGPTDPGEADFDRQPAYTIVDVSLTYYPPNNRWSAEAFVTNATDEAVKMEFFCCSNQTAYGWGARRRGGVRLTYEFN
ncbi:MAG: TonB-dependent receptor [Pseudomonadota bacterium]